MFCWRQAVSLVGDASDSARMTDRDMTVMFSSGRHVTKTGSRDPPGLGPAASPHLLTPPPDLHSSLPTLKPLSVHSKSPPTLPFISSIHPRTAMSSSTCCLTSGSPRPAGGSTVAPAPPPPVREAGAVPPAAVWPQYTSRECLSPQDLSRSRHCQTQPQGGSYTPLLTITTTHPQIAVSLSLSLLHVPYSRNSIRPAGLRPAYIRGDKRAQSWGCDKSDST